MDGNMHETASAGLQARTDSEASSLNQSPVAGTSPCRLCQRRAADGVLPDGTPICADCADVTIHQSDDCPHENTARYGRISNAGEALIELRCEDCGRTVGEVSRP